MAVLSMVTSRCHLMNGQRVATWYLPEHKYLVRGFGLFYIMLLPHHRAVISVYPIMWCQMVLLTLFSWVLLREGRLFPSTKSLMQQLSQHDPAFFLGSR